MSLFERQYKGRGIRFMITISPALKEGDINFLKTLGEISNLSTYFDKIDVSIFDNQKEFSQVKIFCPEAKFNIKLSNAEEKYTKIFYDAFGQIGALCMGLLHRKFQVDEYSFLYRINPKEAPNEFVPLVELKTAGAFLLWGRMYAKSLKEDITKNVKNKDDKNKLKEITKEIDDARLMVAENRDFILKMAQETGVWKPYKTIDDVRISAKLLTDKQIKTLAAVAKEKQLTMHYHWMPLNDVELKLINDYIKTLG